MATLKKYWLAFVGFIAILVGVFLVRPNRNKSSSGISELQKAEEKIRANRIEEQKTDATNVTKDISKLNSERKPETVVKESDMDELAEEYKKL